MRRDWTSRSCACCARAGTRPPWSARCSRSPAPASTGCSGSPSALPAPRSTRPRRPLYLRAIRVVVIAYLTNIALKYVVRRRRPVLDGPAAALLDGHERCPTPRRTPPRRSPPPGCCRARCRPAPLYAVAAAMALSRLYVGVHYPSDIAAGAALGTALAELDPVKVGIVGLPNAGKSSLFNALTSAGARGRQLPVHHGRAQRGVVPVPDERLDAVVETIKATPTVYETIEFHDIAGLVRGAHEGEGLGNRFLGEHPRDRRARARGARARRRAGGASRGPRRSAGATSRRSRPSCSTPTSSRPSAGSTRWRARPSRATRPRWPRRRG